MATKTNKFATFAIGVTLCAFSVSTNASANPKLANMPEPMTQTAPDGDTGDATINWIEVELSNANGGSLGLDILYQGVNHLSEVEYLRIKGTLNDDDWSNIKDMANLKGLDLLQAKITAIPDKQFQNKTQFSLIYLPERITTIGEYAFSKTGLSTIQIPASVTTINQYAFSYSDLTEVTFSEGSVLKTIAEYAFYECSALTSIHIPNSVTSIKRDAFGHCEALNDLTLPSALTTIGAYCFYYTENLKNVAFPESLTSIGSYAFEYSGLENVILPIGLTSLGSEAFRYCRSLKHIELPSYVSKYDDTFDYCNAIEKIVCKAATPPVTSNDIFYGANKSSITLQVPSFAINDYKLDSYWLSFGTIEAMETDPTNIWLGSGTLSLTNNRRPANVTDITLDSNSSLVISGNDPMEIRNLTFYIDTYNNNSSTSKKTGKLLNRCPNVTVGSTRINYYISSYKWFFLTPFTDINLADITHSGDGAFVFRYYNSQYRAENGPNTGGYGSWQDVTAGDKLKAGQGYICQSDKEGWLEWAATDDSKDLAVTAASIITELKAYGADNDANANWNYIGNPYPCYFDSYYMEFTAPFTVWDSYNNTYKAYSTVDDEYVFHPMQAFFVQKPNEDDVTGILFKEEGRQTDATAHHASARSKRAVNADRKIFNIQLSDGNNADRTRTIINSAATLKYDLGCDAAKFMSTNEAMPQVYTIDSDDNLLAFNERPQADGRVRLGFYAGAAGRFTLSTSIPAGCNAQLFDAQTGQTVSLNSQDYVFTVTGAGTCNDRFTLILSTNSTTGIGTTKEAKTTIATINGGIEVNGAAGAAITVYTLDGHKAASANATAGTTVISLPTGLYIVKVGSQSFKAVVE